MSEKGDTCIDSRRDTVDSLIECKNEVNKLLTHSSTTQFKTEENLWNYPKGCYKYGSYLYWNSHERGSSHLSAQQVCKTTGKKPKLAYSFSSYPKCIPL